MTTFLDHFKISPSSEKLDFFNPNLKTDTKLYIDSYYLTRTDNIHCKSALETQKSFMKCLMEALKDQDDLKARELCNHFPEPKFTGIGVTKNGVNGKGSKDIKVEHIITCLKSSKAAQTGLLSDLEELILVAHGIGPDTISDITTNICIKHFAKFTLEQCNKLGIPTSETKDFIHFFCTDELKWKQAKFSLPHVPWGPNDVLGPVLLIPQDILESMISYKSNYFFTNIATPQFTEQVLKNGASASFIYSLKSGEKRVNLKKMREQNPEYRGNKKNMDELISNNPRLLKEYREKVAHNRFMKRKGIKNK
ncbi:hypothetical protein [Acinetobacter sp. YH16032]|uniref:hypothetical protein n=1 Tax=Acinetobacter sp. YH16032 TaxID=2601181 RepID=UPI0015D3F36B|nr:hypothetical protein [Acinetobacter sp. YH16032]